MAHNTSLLALSLVVLALAVVPVRSADYTYMELTVWPDASGGSGSWPAVSLPFAPAVFGHSIRDNVTAQLIPAPDALGLGCGPWQSNRTDALNAAGTPWVAFILRGNCPFSTKALNAEAAGAVAAIIYSCGAGAPFFCNPALLTMSTVIPVDIPTLNMRYADGAFIADKLAAQPNATIHVYIPGTGPIHPADWNALRALVTAPGLSIGVVGEGANGGNREWRDLLLNPTLDPCLHRVYGLWCLHGRVVQISCLNCGFAGPLPPAIGQFSALRWLEFSQGNALNGSLPCELGQLTGLRLLQLDSNQLTGLTPCMQHLRELFVFTASDNLITSVPDELVHLANVSTFDLSLNRLTYINITLLPRLPNVAYVSLAHNQLRMPVPDFSGSQTLALLDLSFNALYGTCDDNFDDMPLLQSVNLETNGLWGSLPAFHNSPAITDVTANYNNFTGPIPASWGALHDLQLVSAAHNALQSPIAALVTCPLLTSVDLSWNQLTSDIGDPNYLDNAGAFMFQSFPNSIQYIVLSHNRIAGVWDDGWTGLKTQLISFDVSYNSLSGPLPADLWSFGSPYVQTLDVSNNQLVGPFPGGLPQASIQTIRAQGNPGMVSPTLSLPSWAAPTTSLMKTDAAQSYSCSIMGGVQRALALTLDPTYYGYTYCVCDPGLYGSAPECLSIPYVVRPGNSTSSQVLLSPATYLITDARFGDNRKITGVETSWVLHHRYTPYNASLTGDDPRVRWLAAFSSPSVRVRAIYIYFNLTADFIGFNDVLAVYYGGESLTGERVVIFRGSDNDGVNRIGNLPEGVVPPLGPAGPDVDLRNIVVVFGATATLQFSSREASGVHFTAEYWFSPDCPDGWAVSEVTNECVRSRPVFALSRGLEIGLGVLVAVVCAFIVGVTFVVFRYRKSVLIRAASKEFCFAMLTFNLVLAVGSILYVTSPSDGKGICDARPWFLCVGLVGTLGCLLAKTERIRKIFNAEKFSRDVMTNRDLLLWVCTLVGVELVFLVAYAAADLSLPELIVGAGSFENYSVWVCSTHHSGYSAWLGVQFAYIGLFVIWGAYVAWHTKSVPSAYNESVHIMLCLFVIIFFAVIVTPLQYLVSDNPRALVLIRTVAQCVLALVLCALLFGPKLWYIWIDRENDRSMTVTLQAQTGSGPKQASRTAGGGAGSPGSGLKYSGAGGSGGSAIRGGGGGGSGGSGDTEGSRNNNHHQHLTRTGSGRSLMATSPPAAGGGNAIGLKRVGKPVPPSPDAASAASAETPAAAAAAPESSRLSEAPPPPPVGRVSDAPDRSGPPTRESTFGATGNNSTRVSATSEAGVLVSVAVPSRGSAAGDGDMATIDLGLASGAHHHVTPSAGALPVPQPAPETY